MAFTISSKYFYGNEVSEYGIEHNRVDYATLAKAFNAVLNNSIMGELAGKGYEFELYSDYMYSDYDGNEYTAEQAKQKIEELQELLDETNEQLAELEYSENNDPNLISDLKDKIDDIERNLESLEEPKEPEVFQYYIVDDNGAEILKDADELVWYCEELDMYLWGVTHYGTSWNYVLTNIEIIERVND